MVEAGRTFLDTSFPTRPRSRSAAMPKSISEGYKTQIRSNAIASMTSASTTPSLGCRTMILFGRGSPSLAVPITQITMAPAINQLRWIWPRSHHRSCTSLPKWAAARPPHWLMVLHNRWDLVVLLRLHQWRGSGSNMGRIGDQQDDIFANQLIMNMHMN